MEKISLKVNDEQVLIQIFPDPLESVDECCRRLKCRLPSIVVELTDSTEVESGELRWPPDDLSSFEAAAAENFFEVSCEADGSDNPEAAPPGEEEAEEKTAVARSDDVPEVVTLPRDNQETARRH